MGPHKLFGSVNPGLLVSISVIFTGALLLLSSCGPDYVYQRKYDIPEKGWTYADTLDFSLAIEDTLSVYNLYLDIRHSRDYPFANLYVNIYTSFPDGQRLHRQLSLELADKLGLWQGDCGRHSCRLTIPIQEGAYFDQPGVYRFTLEQFMRRDSLPGLEEIGFLVEDSGRERG